MKKPKKTAAKKPAPKKSPAKVAKPAKAAKKPRGKTAVFIPLAEPAVPTIDTPPPAEVTITTDAEAVAHEAEEVAPPDTTRLSMSLTQWLDLTDDQRATLSEPEPGAHIEWKHPSVWVFADVPNDLVAIVRATAREMKRWFREDIASESATATG